MVSAFSINSSASIDHTIADRRTRTAHLGLELLLRLAVPRLESIEVVVCTADISHALGDRR
jgi:hypothetical protein